MSKPLDIFGVVKDGRFSQMAAVTTALAAFDGKTVIVTVKERKRTRSLSQNAYLWGVVYPAVLELFREAGNDATVDDVHTYCRLHVAKLREQIHTPDGELFETLGSTTKLTKQQFSDYVEQIRAWAAQFGCVIPLPNEHLTNQGDHHDHN